MLGRLFSVRCLLGMVAAWLSLLLISSPAVAAGIDPYVARYLQAKEPVALDLDGQGEKIEVSPAELLVGKQLFEKNCMNCHVGGATLPNPQVSLSLEALQGASPPRDNINNLIAYLRHPMVYDGSEDTYWCREVPESWMSQEDVTKLAAFVLRAAQKAPGWGTDQF